MGFFGSLSKTLEKKITWGTIGFPTKNNHFRVFWGAPPFKETPTS